SAWHAARHEGQPGAAVTTATQLGAERLHRRVAMAADDMIVDHADCLHEGIGDGRPTEFESALRQFLRHPRRNPGFGRTLTNAAKAIDLWPAVDEIPQQF